LKVEVVISALISFVLGGIELWSNFRLICPCWRCRVKAM